MTAAQLKDLLEHSVATASPLGAINGRFAQISGMRVEYDTTRAARNSAAVAASVGSGDRVRRVVLDDGTVLVDNGAVVPGARTFSFATIDFTANGGDGYPFALNGVVFENTVTSVTYQEALANFITTPKAQGGLKRDNVADGASVTANLYGPEVATDTGGRLIDLAIARDTAGAMRLGTAGRDTLIGTSGNDVIQGGAGADLLTGGAGNDVFRYTSLRDAGDVITDFTPYADKLDLAPLICSAGIPPSTAVSGGFIRWTDVTGGVAIQIDVDGATGPAAPRPLVTLRGLTAAQIAPARDFSPIACAG
jgi:5'-nucleotidase